MTIRKVGYLAGVFDFCHKGHVSIITRSLELCDKLVVAVVSDNYALKYKKQEIFHDENERLNMLQRLNMDLALVIVDNNEHEPFFNEFSITHLFHGTDWEKDQYIDFMGRDAIQKNGTIRDTAVYTIIQSEWSTVKANLEYQLTRER